MSKLLYLFLFLAIVFFFDTMRSTSNVTRVGAGALTAIFGFISMVLILYDFAKQKKSKKEWMIMISSAIVVFIVIMIIYLILRP